MLAITKLLSRTLILTILVCVGLCSATYSIEVTPAMKALIEKNKSLGLNKYPISFWNLSNIAEHGEHMNEAEVKSWADAGFTVPHSPTFDPKDEKQKAHMAKLLKWADKYGMKMIVVDPRGYARKGNMQEYADGIRAAAKDWGKYKATFGFHVGDEPDAAMKDTFFECYKIQKEIAPNLHPYANLLPHFPGIEERAGTDTWPNYLDEYIRKAKPDMLSYDCYTQMNPGEDGVNIYYRNLKFDREAAVRNGVPFWNTILSVGHLFYRCPNQNEIRWQFNTSVAAGANGISWWFYYMLAPNANYRNSPVDELWDKTPTYYDIRRVQQDFHKHYGDLFTRIVSTRVTFYGKVYGDGAEFTPNDMILKVDSTKKTPLLIGEFTDLEGRRYVMFVNNSMTDDDIFNVIFPKGCKTYSYSFNNKEYEGGAYCHLGVQLDGAGNPIHPLMLMPGGEAVYRIEMPK
jgi:hypothetical protein